MSTESIAVIGAIATVLAGFGGAALGACFALDISYKRRRVLWRRAAASFERSAGKLRSSFPKLWVVLP